MKIEKSFSPEPGDRTPSPPSPQVVAIPVARKKTPSPPPVFSPAPIRIQKRILPNRPIPKFHFPFGKPRPRVSFYQLPVSSPYRLRFWLRPEVIIYFRAKQRLSYLHWMNGPRKIRNNLSVLKIWVMWWEKWNYHITGKNRFSVHVAEIKVHNFIKALRTIRITDSLRIDRSSINYF